MKKFALLLTFLLLINSAFSQILLTTSMECDLLTSPNQGAQTLLKIPAYRNVEFIEFIKNNYFKVRFENSTGFVHKVYLVYCDNYYKAIQINKSNFLEIFNKNQASIEKNNKEKIEIEKLWHKGIKQSTSTTAYLDRNQSISSPTSAKTKTYETDEIYNIPVNKEKKSNVFALVIGNEDYSSRQKNIGYESNVEFALKDAILFKDYCIKTLGIEEKNAFVLTNATSAEMNQRIDLIVNILKRYGNESELIFYYAGHGFPNENTREPYIIPVDVNASYLDAAIKLNDLYIKLAESGASKITVFLDACFSGGGRESGLMAARAVKVRPKENIISGNIVVFAASSDDQSALPYKEKEHGLFTYFLLKKINETKGDITLKELDVYLTRNVAIESLRINHKAQDPKTSFSPQVENFWGDWKLK